MINSGLQISSVKERPLIAISGCLAGQKVRHDGRNAPFPSAADKWLNFFELLPLCPEIGCGMTVPRGETKLLRSEGKISLVDSVSMVDYTANMVNYAQTQADFLIDSDICGFIFKRGSASCGLEHLPVVNQASNVSDVNGKGLFATVFTTLNPHVPVIEEHRLRNPMQAEHYLARVRFYKQWLMYGKNGWTESKIRQFHHNSRYFFLSRVPQLVLTLEKLIDSLEETPTHCETIALEYMTKAQKGLNVVSKKGQIANTMELVLSRFSNYLTNTEKQEVIEQIHAFRTGDLPRSVPLSILEKYHQRYTIDDKSVDMFITSIPLEINIDS